jgi:hypothetical protein
MLNESGTLSSRAITTHTRRRRFVHQFSVAARIRLPLQRTPICERKKPLV